MHYLLLYANISIYLCKYVSDSLNTKISINLTAISALWLTFEMILIYFAFVHFQSDVGAWMKQEVVFLICNYEFLGKIKVNSRYLKSFISPEESSSTPRLALSLFAVPSSIDRVSAVASKYTKYVVKVCHSLLKIYLHLSVTPCWLGTVVVWEWEGECAQYEDPARLSDVSVTSDTPPACSVRTGDSSWDINFM